MEPKTKDLLSLLGLPEDQANNLEQLRETFEQKYVPIEALKDPKNPHAAALGSALVGKVTGVAQTSLKRKLKSYGLELTSDEMKDKPLEALVELGLDKLHEHTSQQLKALETQLSQSSDQKSQELSAKLDKLQAKYADTTALLEQARAQYESERGQWETQLKGQRLEWERAKLHETAIKWRPDVKEVEREGFFSKLSKTYRLELDEQGQLEVLDASGKRIPSARQAHSFKTYEEVLEETGRALGVWAENPKAGQPVAATPSFVAGASATSAHVVAPAAGDGRVRKMSSRLVRR